MENTSFTVPNRGTVKLVFKYSQGHIQVLIPVGLADGEPVVHVLAVGAGVGELLEALEALERFLAGVQALVLRQVVLVLERLRAHLALVWPLTCK